ncbi:MAG: hypothetical protein GX677_03020 [Treponema sp.]|nr:hypothetical protein [Treponema sp.]
MSNSSLKNEIESKIDNTIYTKELEQDLLTIPLNKFDNISENVHLSTELLTVNNSSNKEIFPYLENLGIISNNKYIENINQINTIILEISKKGFFCINEKFAQENYYNFILFYDSVTNNCSDSTYLLNQADKKENIFNSYIIGEIFNSHGVVQIPVRFFYDKRQLDVIIYMNNDSKLIKIELA